MLTETQYEDQHEQLASRITSVQQQLDGALVTSNGASTATVEKIRAGLKLLTQQRDDLDTAWRGMASRNVILARQRQRRDRNNAVERMHQMVDEMVVTLDELQKSGALFRQLAARYQASESTLRRFLQPFAQHQRHRDAIAILGNLVRDKDLLALCTDQVDLAPQVRRRAEEVKKYLHPLLAASDGSEATSSILVEAE